VRLKPQLYAIIPLRKRALFITTARVPTEKTVIGSFAKRPHLIRSVTQEVQIGSQLQAEIAMRSQLGEIADTIERLRSDPELLSRIYGREAAFHIAMREALANAVTHGNRHDGFKKVYVPYTCEPHNSLSIIVRDEGDGFDPNDVPIPKDMGQDTRRGIYLMTSCMDEVQFRRNGTEVYMRMTAHQDSSA
jgi:anti-sigma regulatory factor (Ser/Thr protein kinase)